MHMELEGRLDDVTQGRWDGFVYDLRGRETAQIQAELERLAPVALPPIKLSR